MDPLKIFVRVPKNGDKSRRIVSFRMAERIPQDIVLALGGAIDGSQAVFDVENPLKDHALLRLERNLVLLFREHNYKPEFG